MKFLLGYKEGDHLRPIEMNVVDTLEEVVFAVHKIALKVIIETEHGERWDDFAREGFTKTKGVSAIDFWAAWEDGVKHSIFQEPLIMLKGGLDVTK